jgi:hypothetical protein
MKNWKMKLPEAPAELPREVKKAIKDAFRTMKPVLLLRCGTTTSASPDKISGKRPAWRRLRLR